MHCFDLWTGVVKLFTASWGCKEVIQSHLGHTGLNVVLAPIKSRTIWLSSKNQAGILSHGYCQLGSWSQNLLVCQWQLFTLPQHFCSRWNRLTVVVSEDQDLRCIELHRCKTRNLKQLPCLSLGTEQTPSCVCKRWIGQSLDHVHDVSKQADIHTCCAYALCLGEASQPVWLACKVQNSQPQHHVLATTPRWLTKEESQADSIYSW